eukprot:CAMPEP_0177274984 /NCGR_PEP_ID=MMETSP0367-20130122/67469_1 /TAXON_ID=447022 ORGANISM="Scrippsiella hangoei-like, Strain SHHI-4" /NCGR_SAMPLE_ID=MMETSP0367 /ASSEMBLY_ACC=CAM_ASM_000362 /LENGTH=212 /DNA_ID=CAMNT_0018731377 /DNA_START=125 /DNA_END=761 /DNA_ORIENTATION=+
MCLCPRRGGQAADRQDAEEHTDHDAVEDRVEELAGEVDLGLVDVHEEPLVDPKGQREEDEASRHHCRRHHAIHKGQHKDDHQVRHLRLKHAVGKIRLCAREQRIYRRYPQQQQRHARADPRDHEREEVKGHLGNGAPQDGRHAGGPVDDLPERIHERGAKDSQPEGEKLEEEVSPHDASINVRFRFAKLKVLRQQAQGIGQQVDKHHQRQHW